MLARLAVFSALFFLAGCDSGSTGSREIRTDPVSAVPFATEPDGPGSTDVVFRYEGRTPEGCYDLKGIQSLGSFNDPLPRGEYRVEITVRETTGCQAPSETFVLDSLRLPAPYAPPGTYSYVFEGRGDAVLVRTVRLAADGTLVE